MSTNMGSKTNTDTNSRASLNANPMSMGHHIPSVCVGCEKPSHNTKPSDNCSKKKQAYYEAERARA